MSDTPNVVWSIQKIYLRLSDGFIEFAVWKAVEASGMIEAEASGVVHFIDGTPSKQYVDVTEEDVLEWVWNSGVIKDEIEAHLVDYSKAEENPNLVTGVPWLARQLQDIETNSD